MNIFKRIIISYLVAAVFGNIAFGITAIIVIILMYFGVGSSQTIIFAFAAGIGGVLLGLFMGTIAPSYWLSVGLKLRDVIPLYRKKRLTEKREHQ